MLQARDRRLASLPRYLVQLPWIGPIQGGMIPEGGEQLLQLGAASDPVLGEALRAAYLPVSRADGRFVRAGGGWVAPTRANAEGRFRFEAPLQWWDGPIAGVLMLLVYDRSTTVYDPQARKNAGRVFPPTWSGQLEYFKAGMKVDATSPVADLPPPMREELEKRIDQLLQRPASELELGLGLIELDRRAAAANLTFAVASCQYPANFVDGDVAQRSYKRLQARMSDPIEHQRPRCLLLVGDQVYIDATAGLFDPSALSDRYDLPYERLLQTEPLRHVLRRIPLYTMLDDHEIEDNWEPSDSPESRENLVNGRKYFREYQRIAWPRTAASDPLWQRFKFGDFPFFLVDTRTEREARTAGNFDTARIMKPQQWDALRHWLDEYRKKDIPMFIASPSSFLPRHRRATHGPSGAGALRSDGWDGYPASFHDIVRHIAANSIRNVVFLSGDEHISFATKAVIRDGSGNEVTRILSIHSSGLYAPFSFANAALDNLACCESFPSGPYRCEVSTEFAPPGDGFTLVRAWRDNGRWRIRCCFDREPPAPEVCFDREPPAEVWIDLA